MATGEKLGCRFPDTVYTALVHPEQHLGFKYTGFHPGKTQKLPRDLAIPMRDGIKLYADIFRPANEHEQVPAIIPWSPYGKVGTSTLSSDNMRPWHIGMSYQNLSGYERLKYGPNPAEWCSRGCAVVDVDARGCGNSEGDLMFWGQQEATDICDSITWIAQQPWCKGSIVRMGNSWLAILQLNFASRFSHPNLKAIAPWEGLSDPYGQRSCRGGIPRLSFADLTIQAFADKPENIRDITMYLTASYSTLLHFEGSFHSFEVAQTPRKWLRLHASQEWHDLYRSEAMNDLQRFFDFYAKGVQNGWEKDAPPVRLSLLGYDGSYAKSVVERPEQQWPPARQHMRRYYLDAASLSLATTKPDTPSQVAHEGHSLTDSSDFVLYFDGYTEVCGRPFVKLCMSCDIRKISSSGELLESLNWSPMPKPGPEVPNINIAKHLGQQGMFRASHHVSLRPHQGGDEVPQYNHKARQPITPGVAVPLLIPIWPVGMVFEAGEGLMLRVSGHDMAFPEAENLRPTSPVDENRGIHTVYTGGKHESCLMVPVITD
ncbi:Alpha/Beta hydrolase protein [Aspergillus similis]